MAAPDFLPRSLRRGERRAMQRGRWPRGRRRRRRAEELPDQAKGRLRCDRQILAKPRAPADCGIPSSGVVSGFSRCAARLGPR